VKGTATLEPKADRSQGTVSRQQAGAAVLTTTRQNWFHRTLCGIGLHSGRWNYLAESKCGQMRVCARCGKASQRTKHVRHWDYTREGECDQRKICGRCEQIAGRRTRHVWGPTYSIGRSESGHRCQRCKLEQTWTNSG
jgi:hypothetical protein